MGSLNLLAANGVHLAQEHKRQVLSLDSEFEEMEAERTALRAENLNLQAQVNPLKREVDQLKEQIAREKTRAKPPLDEKAEGLLYAIAHARKGKFDESNAAKAIGGNEAEAVYYLGLLHSRFLIKRARYFNPQRSIASPRQPGLQYLKSKGRL